MDSAETIQNAAMERSGDCTAEPQLGSVRLCSIRWQSHRSEPRLLHVAFAHHHGGQARFQGNIGLGATHCSSAGVCAVLVQVSSYGSLPWISLVVSSSFALYGAMRKKIEADTMQGLFIETMCMAPFALGWLWLTGGAGMGQHDLKVDAFLMLAGVFTTAPLLTYIAASRLLPLNVVGLTSYLGPTLQLLVAQTLLGETIDSVTALSFALVWLGVLLVSGQGLMNRARYRNPPRGKLDG